MTLGASELTRLDHDLRGPLNAILGFGRLLETEELTPDQRECVEQILRGGEQLQALITTALGSA
ncbi:MAG: histidine kinase dimerization/phospho-acceptor domain-containing protein [Acidimicrobiia bacterium]